jgi:hypothetical protein
MTRDESVDTLGKAEQNKQEPEQDAVAGPSAATRPSLAPTSPEKPCVADQAGKNGLSFTARNRIAKR